MELEAIRAQQRALLQASPTSSTTLTQPPANPSTLLEAAAQAAETAANNTGNLQTSEEEKEETPSERGVDAAGDGSGNYFNTTREEQRRTQPTAPLNQDLNEMLRAIQEQNQQMMSSMGIQLRNMQAELSTLKLKSSKFHCFNTCNPKSCPTPYEANQRRFGSAVSYEPRQQQRFAWFSSRLHSTTSTVRRQSRTHAATQSEPQ